MKWIFYVIVFFYMFYRAVYGHKELNSLSIEPVIYEDNINYLPAGTRKTIACKGPNKNQKVEWLNNYGEVVKHENSNRVFSQTKYLLNTSEGRVTEQVLTFSHAYVKDSGIYTCRSDKISQEVEICVIDPSHFIETPNAVTVTEGRSFTLSCQARGQPEPRIMWNRNGEDIKDDDDESSKYRLMIKYNRQGFESLLTITSLEAEDNGIYTCNAVQENPELSNCSLSRSWNISLFVNHAPMFADSNHIELVYAKDNQSGDLVCTASAFPKPTYRWFRYEDDNTLFEYPHKQINISRDGNEATLSIVADKYSYGRKFACKATNEFGESFKNFTIVKLERPDKPNEVTVVQSINTELVLNVTWLDIHFPIDEIEAQYMVISGRSSRRKSPREIEWKRGELDKLVKVNKNDDSIYTLKGLDEDKDYWIRVRANNEAGNSPWSHPITVSTTKTETTLLIVTMATDEIGIELETNSLDEELKDEEEDEEGEEKSDEESNSFDEAFFGLLFVGVLVLACLCSFLMKMV
ncbi:limbic system-associated membrane protein [Aphomia sociella]